MEKHTTLKWARSFLLDLKRSHQLVVSLTHSQPRQTNLSYYMGATYNLSKHRLIKRGFHCIDEEVLIKIQRTYGHSKNRLIIIDHEVRPFAILIH